MVSFGGLLAAGAAAVAFGVQYLPVKQYESKIYDGATFQWFMCNGILFAGIIVTAASQELEGGCPPLVMFGGCLWALSNYAVIPLVHLLGMSLGFSLYNFVNIVVGYCTGRFGLFGVKRLEPAFDGGLWYCDAGCVMVLCSFVAMLLMEADAPQGHPEDFLPTERGSARRAPSLPVVMSGESPPDSPPSAMEMTVPEVDIAANHTGRRDSEGNMLVCEKQANAFATTGFALHGSRNFISRESLASAAAAASASSLSSSQLILQSEVRGSAVLPKAAPRTKQVLGGALALVAGGFAGLQSVPATLYTHQHKELSATATVLPQCLGIWFASCCIYWVYGSIAKLRNWSVPHSVIRPAFVSGCIWTAGFSLMITGISELGFTIGYTMDGVGPIAVSSVLGIFVFKEIRGTKQLVVYSVAEVMQLLGVLLITLCGKGK
mmetsp:Transcript_68009/g.127010  ORF Transcript_68009/g.127010 Transcript_68009/m.127010 type:complete len:434 (+) Transcript_68009:52-1353(+)